MPDDTFRVGRNTIEGRVSPDAEVKKPLQTPATFEKIDTPKVLPELLRFTDAKTGLDNVVVSSGMPARLKGKRMKFAGGEKQRVFFVPGETTIRTNVYLEATDTKIVFSTPLLEKGKSYDVQVRIAGDGRQVVEIEMSEVADEESIE